jgi:hypothetical protein
MASVSMDARVKRWLVVLVPVAMLSAISETSAAPAQLASHRAVYNMTLGTARAGSSTVDAQGAMYLEWAESCDGWTVSQRVRLTLYATQGGEVDTDSNFSSWESRDGKKYQFTVRNLRDNKVSEEFRGDAHLDGPGRSGKATFSTPPGVTFNLPKGALFPTEHMAELIAAAQKGVTRLSRVIFDGANLDGPLEVNAIIGGPVHPTSGGAPSGVTGEGQNLTNRPSWPVRMAFFPTKSQQAEPEYEVEVRLFDNGIANYFLLDYGDFTVHAALEKLEALPKPKC